MDPLGSIPMNQQTQTLLGLPSLELSVQGDIWDHSQYLTVFEYIRHQGFDPSEVKYAQAQGYPIFEVQDDEGFEIIDTEEAHWEDCEILIDCTMQENKLKIETGLTDTNTK